MFSLSSTNLDRDELHQSLSDESAGAIVVFEGWVRNHNQGKKVKSLEYQIYHELALKEGERILREAREKFQLKTIRAIHREGHLALGEIAVWIGATAAHRDDAFKACRFVIDEIKRRLPVWKKEHYLDQTPEWVFCRDHAHHVHFHEHDYYQKNLYPALKGKSVLVIGAGGLGCPALVGLASAGVEKITIVDPDTIEIHNIHRQFLYTPNLVGEKKALVAKSRIKELNPFLQVESVCDFFDSSMINHDLVLDCTDNMVSKFDIHDACLKARVPLITAGIHRSEAQLRTIVPGQGCLRCLSEKTPDDTLLGNCNDVGVLGAQVNVIGSLQASEAIEYLAHGTNQSMRHTLLWDLRHQSQLRLKNHQKPDCVYCEGKFVLNSSVYGTEGKVVDIRNGVDLEEIKFSQEKILLACDGGVTSRKLAEALRAKGHLNIFALRGGIKRPPHQEGAKSCGHQH
jgi:adenylyltransferase/sulfurtransferase